MEIPILQDIVVILGLSIGIILIFQRLNLPSLIGFFIAGVIAGPNGFNLIQSTHEVELLSEIGIIFLLFIIGIEFSLKGLSSVRNRVIFGGGLQVGLTILVTFLVAFWLGLDWNSAVFLGFLFGLSSTAIVLKIIQEKGEVSAPHGKFAVAILIFQDIVVVPMMLLTPILAGQSEDPIRELAWMAVKVIVVVGLIILLAKFVVPYLLRAVVKTKNRELFLLSVTVFCLTIAWMTSLAGLSLALGAFFAGLIISESEYSHQATANVLPFREVFISFFFISVGTLLDIDFIGSHFMMIVGLTAGVMILKILVVVLTVRVFGFPWRTVLMTALSLFQVGEFSLLLSTVGMEYGIMSPEVYQYFLSVAVLSMAVTPFVMRSSGAISGFFLGWIFGEADTIKGNTKKYQASSLDEHCNDHVVIVGYGINGGNIAKAAQQANIPYVILELDPDQFEKAKEDHDFVVFGDAADPMILKHVNIQDARVLVIAISDPDATHRIITTTRLFSKTVYIVVRTRYVKEIDKNLSLGADVVIPEEFETSIEIFTRVLKKYMIPNHEIQAFITHIRSSDYLMLTSKDRLPSKSNHLSFEIPDKEITTLRVQKSSSKFVGQSLADSGLRNEFDVTVLSIKRGEEYITEVGPEVTIQQDDLLFLFGKPEDIYNLNKHLQ